jgi:hypothetical protein
MKGKSFSSIFLLAFAVTAISFSQLVLAERKDCEALRKDLEFKRGQLAEYLVTLDKFREKGDPKLESLLRYKINELLVQINEAEEVTGCAQVKEPEAPEGMSPVKTDAGEYVTKSCAELRTMLVQLLRRATPLKRREHSTFSELTPAEKTVMRESFRELRMVTTILKARCSREASAGARVTERKEKRIRNRTNLVPHERTD